MQVTFNLGHFTPLGNPERKHYTCLILVAGSVSEEQKVFITKLRENKYCESMLRTDKQDSNDQLGQYLNRFTGSIVALTFNEQPNSCIKLLKEYPNVRRVDITNFPLTNFSFKELTTSEIYTFAGSVDMPSTNFELFFE